MHAQEPTGSHAGVVPDVACAPQENSAVFTRAPPGPEPAFLSELARDAAFDSKPRLTWFVEAVAPDGSPWPAPLPDMTIDAALHEGGLPGEPGAVLAEAQATLEPVDQAVPDRAVYAFQLPLQWTDGARIPAAGGLGLHVALWALAAPCGEVAWPGLRPVSEPDLRPRIEWDLFDPVRVDLLEGSWDGDALRITLHASSPWGHQALASPVPPTITGQDGVPRPAVLADLDAGLDQRSTWTWMPDQPRNGTYRIDATASTLDGSSAFEDQAFFRIGSDAPRGFTPPPAPVEESPGLGILAIMGLLAAALRRR